MADDDLSFEFEAHLEKKQHLLPGAGGPGLQQRSMIMVPPQELIGQQPGNYRKNYKKTVCTYWLRGMCMKGDQCGFLHQYDVEKMPICRNLVRYGECKDIDCPYKHDTEEIKECNMYKLGFCIYGPQCRFKHKPSPGPPPPVESIEAAKPKEVRNINAVVNSVNPGVIEDRDKLQRLEARPGWSDPQGIKRPRALPWTGMGDVKPDVPGPRPPALPAPPSQQPSHAAPWQGSQQTDRPPVPGPRPPDHPPPAHLQPPPSHPSAGVPGPRPPVGPPPDTASQQQQTHQQQGEQQQEQPLDQKGAEQQQQGMLQGMPNIHPPGQHGGPQQQGPGMPSLIPGGPGQQQGMGQHGMGPGFQYGNMMPMGPGFMPMVNQGMMGVQGMAPPMGMQGMMIPQGNVMVGMNMMGSGMMMNMPPTGGY